MIKSLQLNAYAKINLGLDVISKRPDGYHEVRMIMQTIGLYDKLLMNVTNSPNIKIKTNLPYLPNNENNLVYKAVSLLKDKYQIKQGVYINLKKKIPVSAGLAGGSTDAAAALYGMNRLFDLKLTTKELMDFGVKLGADVPYCIIRGTALSEGIGEKLTPLPPFPQCHVLIVKPNINVSTKLIYENLDLSKIKNHPDIDGIIRFMKQNDLYKAASLFDNVLETVTIKNYPEIQDIKNQMLNYGAIASIMSGSGPTVFGIFDSFEKGKAAFYNFKVTDFGYQVFLTKPYNPKNNYNL